MSVEAIAEWLRQETSPLGLEVASQGDRTLTLRAPADLPLTETTAALWNRFGATCELRQNGANQGAAIVVWLPRGDSGDCSSSRHEDPPKETLSAVQMCLIPVMSIIACFFVQHAVSVFVKPENPNATLTELIFVSVQSFLQKFQQEGNNSL